MKKATIAYVGPFFAFVALLGLSKSWPLPEVASQALFVVLMAGVLLFVGRPAIDLRIRSLGGTLAVGVGVFVVWILPDLLFPGYRHGALFENSLLGKAAGALPEAVRSDRVVLILRAARASLIVPIAEELFWRGWLMRWIVSTEFERVPLGAYAPSAFWIVASAFASEHGSYWDVGLAAGIAYNWWMIRTKSLGDLILAHAVTNAVLSAYVVFAGKWEYWL